MPFVAPKNTSTTSGNAAGRTAFRPPWVKEDGAQGGLKPTTKNSVPWAKKNDTKVVETPNASILKKTTPSPTLTKANVEPSLKTKKTTEPPKKSDEPPKKITTPIKKVPESVKKPIASNAATKSAIGKKKNPTPPSSSEEEESDEEEETEEETEEQTEEETEEESEEESEESEDEESAEASEENEKTKSNIKGQTPVTNKTTPLVTAATKKIIPPKAQLPQKEEEESELKRRFSLEKPKLRPVVIKRDKSMKRIEDDDEAIEGETEEERERRLRFKLEKPKLRHIKREEKPIPSKSTENILKIRPSLKKVPKVDELLKETKDEPKPEFKTKTLRKTPSIKREPSMKSVPAPPPLPSLVPKAPPPPPPPLGKSGEKKEISEARKQAIEKLKTRPRRRPDWSEMMKEVEDGKKLRHVECNDRSQPILTCKSMTKVDNKFIYETEKDNSHNKLLKQIQGGIKLKPTQTNDRSKPFIEGLRKFRRQMTIEEQLQKSQSKINMLANASGAAGTSDTTDGTGPLTSSTRAGSIVSGLILDDASGDELDDIDKIRDDLQSTKQMLALELRNREAQERENKKLLAKIATLEAELEREKSRDKTLEYGSRIIVATMETTPASEEAFVNSLKQDAEESKKTAQELEKKYLTTGEQLDQAKSEIEEQKRQIQILERKLSQALQDHQLTNSTQFDFCYDYDDIDYTLLNHYNGKSKGNGIDSRRASDVHNGSDSSPEFDLGESESDPDEPEEKKNERREKRLIKEIKVLRSKLTKLKVKEEAAKKEKLALKEAMKKNHVILKEEHKKFKKLEKEVHKMAASMKEDVDDEEENDDNEDEEEQNEEKRESEEESEVESEESESEESDNETESEPEAEDANNLTKKENLEPRVKRHEGRLNAMKKCNVLLQANVDNLQDEISQVRYKASNLQSELDSVLADLGF